MGCINNSPHAVTGETPFKLMFSHDNHLLPAYPIIQQKLRIDKYKTVMKSRYDTKHKVQEILYRRFSIVERWLSSRSQSQCDKKKNQEVYTQGHTRLLRLTIQLIAIRLIVFKVSKVIENSVQQFPLIFLRPYKSPVSDSSTESDHEVDREDLIDLLES